MKCKKITLGYGQVANFYKYGMYIGGLGAGASFEISKLPADFMITLKDNPIVCTYFCTRIYIENFEDGDIIEKIDFEEVEKLELITKVSTD